MKKLISLVVALVMLAGMLPAMGVSAAAPVADENIALGKPVYASHDRGDGYKPSSVVDGNPNSMWAGPAGAVDCYVMVDLGEPYVITSVMLYNRNDTSVEQYRRNVNIEFSNTPDFAVRESVVAMSGQEAPFGEPVEVKPLTKTPYRYVRAIKTNNTTHCVNEIEVFGYINDPDAVKIGSDIEGTKYEGAVSLLSYLKKISLKDFDEDIFGRDIIITRGEACKMVVDAFGAQNNFSGGVPFGDVDTDHRYYDAIRSAYYLGYIVGDGCCYFRPDDFVTKTELIYMTLRAIGYTDVIQSLFAGDSSKVISQAKRLDLMDGIDSSDYSEPVTRADAALMFYNAYLAPEFNLSAVSEGKLIYEDENNYLLRNHGLVLTQGIVEENRVTALSGDPKTNSDAAVVGGTEFMDMSGKLDSYLANEVVVACHEDNPARILTAWRTYNDTSVVLPASSLSSTKADIKAGRVVAYQDADSSKTKSYSLEDKYKVVKNNLSHPYYKPEDLMLTNGQLRLTDSNGNGKYEAVFIEEYSLHYIDTAFFDDEEFTFIDSKGTRRVLDRETLSITGASGSAMAPKKVTRGTVIKLYGNDDGTYCHITLFNEPVTGRVTELSTDTIAIDSTAYPMSLAYKNLDIDVEAELEETVFAFVDEAGELIWVERDVDTINGDWVIAYAQDTSISTGLNSDLMFRFFTINSEWKELGVADKLELDGSTVTKAQLTNLVKTTEPGRFVNELIRYKLNSSGVIIALDTMEETSVERARGNSLAKGATITSGLFTSRSSAFWSGQDMIAQATEDTKLFTIPRVDGEIAKGRGYDNSFRLDPLSYEVVSHRSYSGNLITYMPDESGYPACIVRYIDISSSTGSSGLAAVRKGKPYMLVTRVVKAINDDGEPAVKVTGRRIDNTGIGQETSFYTEENLKVVESGLLYQEKGITEDSVLTSEYLIDINKVNALDTRTRYVSDIDKLGFGDIIRFDIQTGSTATAVERVFDYDKNNLPVSGTEETARDKAWYSAEGNPGAYSVYYRFQLGQLSNLTKTAFSINTHRDTTETFLRKYYGTVLVCEDNGLTTEVKNANLDEWQGADAKMMLFSYNGSPLAIIIYPY